jgi:ADP-heptose:LPS heptosyltransferase
MCVRKPKSLEAFSNVHGVGKTKQQKYGQRFIDLIGSNSLDMQDTVDTHKNVPQNSFAEYKDSLIEKGLNSVYKPWSPEEDEKLKEELKNEMTVSQMSKSHLRTAGAIRSRLKKLAQENGNY